MVEAAEFHVSFSIPPSLRAAQRRGNPENRFTRSHEEEGSHEESSRVLRALISSFVPSCEKMKSWVPAARE
jgi:hypothetical protein